MKAETSDTNDKIAYKSNNLKEMLEQKLHRYCLAENNISSYKESSVLSDKTMHHDTFTTNSSVLCANFKYSDDIAEDILLLINSDKNKPDIQIDAKDIIMIFRLIFENIIQNKISLINNVDLKYRYENYINVKLDNLTYPNNISKDEFYYIFKIFIDLNILIRIPVIQLGKRFFHDYKLYVTTPNLFIDWSDAYSQNDNRLDMLLENLFTTQIYILTSNNQDIRIYSLIDEKKAVKIDLVIEDIAKNEVHLIKFNDSPENNLRCFNNIDILKLFINHNVITYAVNDGNYIEIFEQLESILINNQLNPIQP